MRGAPTIGADRKPRRGREVARRRRRLLGSLLRPYRWRVALMLLALLFATAAALAPPPLAKLAIDEGIVPGDVAALDWIVVAFVGSALVYWAPPTSRPISSAGSASEPCRTCASASSRTCRRCPWASTRAARRAC